MEPTLELVLRLCVAGLLGAAVGLEREIRGRDPGIRTHALVALGAALFTLAGAYGFSDIPTSPNVDPARLAAQVAAGIGFIGAGAIIRSGISVRGLTTAATLWMSAALGVTAGAGAYVLAVAATAVGFLILVGFALAKPLIRDRLGPSRRILHMEYELGHGTLGPILRDLERVNCHLNALRLEDDHQREPGRAAGVRHATIDVTAPDDDSLRELLRAWRERREVRLARVDPS
jgi:putative Mg2+ transporter-C (MgtC) family protein